MSHLLTFQHLSCKKFFSPQRSQNWLLVLTKNFVCTMSRANLWMTYKSKLHNLKNEQRPVSKGSYRVLWITPEPIDAISRRLELITRPTPLIVLIKYKTCFDWMYRFLWFHRYGLCNGISCYNLILFVNASSSDYFIIWIWSLHVKEVSLATRCNSTDITLIFKKQIVVESIVVKYSKPTVNWQIWFSFEGSNLYAYVSKQK